MNIRKRNELILYSIIMLTAVCSFWISHAEKPEMIVVESETETLYLSFSENKHITLHGPFGNTVLELNNGKFRILSSPCPEQICVKQGWEKTGCIICVPQKIRIYAAQEGIDAVTQ